MSKRWRVLLGVCFAALLLAAPATPVRAEAGDTLRLVRARGDLRCGVSERIVGFSLRDATGALSGMDVDFGRAIAAVVLGDPTKVHVIPLRATARFPAIASREIDPAQQDWGKNK